MTGVKNWITGFCKAHLWDENPVLQLYFLCFFLMGWNFAFYFLYGPLYLPKLGLESVSAISLLVGIPGLGAILGQNFWGALCLRKDRFRLFVLLFSFSYLPILAAFSLALDYRYFLWVLFFQGFFQSGIFPSAQTLTTLLNPDDKGESLGKLYAYESVGWGFCSFLCASYFGMQATIGVGEYQKLSLVILSFNLICIAILFWKFPRQISGLSWEHIQSNDLSGYARVLKRKRLLALFAVILLAEIGSTMFFFYFSRYYIEVLGASEMLLGYVMLFCTLLGTITYPLAGRLLDSKGSEWLLAVSLGIYLSMFGLLGVLSDKFLVGLIYLIPIYPLIAISANGAIANYTSEKDRAIGFGLMDSLFFTASTLSPFLGGFLLRHYPLTSLPWLTLAVVSFALAPLAFLIWHSRRRKALLDLGEPVEGQ